MIVLSLFQKEDRQPVEMNDFINYIKECMVLYNHLLKGYDVHRTNTYIFNSASY